MTAVPSDVEPQTEAAPRAAPPLPPILQLDPVSPAAAADGRWRTWLAAWLLAILVHASLVSALTQEPAELIPGGGGEQVEAISLTLVSSYVLESRDTTVVQPAPAPAATRVDESDGSQDKERAPEVKPKDGREEENEGEAKEKPQEEVVRAVEALVELPLEEGAPRKQQQSTAAGGNSVRTDIVTEQPSPRVRAPAAASPGAVREYGRHVALALSKSKPKGLGSRGKVVRVIFTIAADGGLAAAEVAKSSGNPKLDDMVLEAVRRTKFPVPPLGMTTAQLTYQVPYKVR